MTESDEIAKAVARAEEIAAHHMLWVWFQYGQGGRSSPTGVMALPCQCMQAGEQAGDWLAERGYVVNEEWDVVVTAKGRELMERKDIGS